MKFINPYWHIAAAMGLYLNTLDFFKKLHNGEPTNRNVIVGTILAGYLALSTIALAAT